MNAISTIAQPMPLQDMQTLAVAIAKSNLFGIKTPEQALVLMAIAQAEGRHPVEAARDYDIINGKPAKKAEAMLRDFILAGGKVQWHALTDELADATFTHPQTGEVRIDWDMKRAMTAFGKKDMYAKFPRQMLRSRVVSEGVRTLWPLATSGMYVPEEQADIPAKETPHTGPTIDADKPSEARQAINDAVPMQPLRSAAAATPRAERKVDPTPYEAGPPAPDRKSWTQWAESLERADRDSYTTAEIGRIIAKSEIAEIVRLAQEGEPSPAKTRIVAAFRNLEARYLADPPQPPDADDLDEVHIHNEDKLAAG